MGSIASSAPGHPQLLVYTKLTVLCIENLLPVWGGVQLNALMHICKKHGFHYVIVEANHMLWTQTNWPLGISTRLSRRAEGWFCVMTHMGIPISSRGSGNKYLHQGFDLVNSITPHWDFDLRSQWLGIFLGRVSHILPCICNLLIPLSLSRWQQWMSKDAHPLPLMFDITAVICEPHRLVSLARLIAI